MTKKSSSGSGMFLMEMIIVVFFFILCASTCILVFVKSNSQSVLASETNRSVVAAESIAEAYKGGRWEEYLAAVRGKELEDGSFQINWDKSWNPAEGTSAAYQASVITGNRDLLRTADIIIVRIRDKKELFKLQIQKYDKKKI